MYVKGGYFRDLLPTINWCIQRTPDAIEINKETILILLCVGCGDSREECIVDVIVGSRWFSRILFHRHLQRLRRDE